MARKRTAVLISGRGSNMASLIKAAHDPSYPAEIQLVIADRADAKGLETAAAEGIEAIAIERKGFDSKQSFEEAIHQAMVERDIEVVCLAGFMRLLSADFVGKWYGSLLNIHPSLLPDFKGLDAQAQALEAGAKEAGCTVHLVSADMDAGPILMQARVPVEADDSVDSLSARILVEEHRIYPEALALLASGRVQVDGDKISVS
ncbi:MAG: phosphoribosylglycinamide formyltransferase [Alphaproteobacteria bacterium]|nr:phosphoribosylglycinamide formyltransferase [Alphaproteobacteria bacterium SS10]